MRCVSGGCHGTAYTYTHCAAVAEDCRSVINVLIAPSGGLKLVSVTVKPVQKKNSTPDLVRFTHVLCSSDRLYAKDYNIITL